MFIKYGNKNMRNSFYIPSSIINMYLYLLFSLFEVNVTRSLKQIYNQNDNDNIIIQLNNKT